ncbi:MAG: mechanosensitive ion channel [Bdellovibrionales bacterium]|nr:mechanosensitive ion channel [Bdellovibrionales bacterium]
MDNKQVDQMAQFFEMFDLQKILFFLIGLFVLVGVVKLLSFAADKIEKVFPARRLLISQVETVLSFFTYIFGVNFLFFTIIRPPKELLLAAGGSIAVAVGLSLKDLVASIIAGLILLFDRPFQVGDRVSFEGNYGEIQSIGLRAVRLVTLDDSIVTIPNSKFITEAVSSGNAGALDMMVVVKFYFDRSVDIKTVREKLKDIISTSRFVYLKKPIIVIVSEELVLGEPVVLVTGKSYVLDVKYEKAFETDIYTRALQVFKNFPRPQVNSAPIAKVSQIEN